MKIALCQINTVAADLEGNIETCLAAIKQVLPDKPDLIILPEMAVCGFHPLDILYDQSFSEALMAANQDFALLNQHHPPILFGSLNPAEITTNSVKKFYNCAFLARQGKLEIVAQQEFLWDFDIHFDSRWFISKHLRKPFSIHGKNILPLVGKDFLEIINQGDMSILKQPTTPDLVVSLSNTVFTKNSHQTLDSLIKKCPYPAIVINQVGGFDSLILDGGSTVFDPFSTTIHAIPQFEPSTEIVNFPNPLFSSTPPTNQEEQLIRAIQLGIHDFFHKNKIHHAFIGLSGGIDSAVTAWLTAEAIGNNNLTGLSLPSRYNHPNSTDSAKELSEKLGIKYQEVSIEPFLTLFEKQLPELFDNQSVSENIQPRIRTLILMAYVNFYGGMLINTSNKTELTLGYGTLYGDLAGTLSPIGDLTKSQIYDLAKWINCKGEIIPSFILNRKPSAELKPDQVDPFDYPHVSPLLEKLVQNNQSNPIMRSNEYKRSQFGTILKVSEKSFGVGRFIPISRK